VAIVKVLHAAVIAPWVSSSRTRVRASPYALSSSDCCHSRRRASHPVQPLTPASRILRIGAYARCGRRMLAGAVGDPRCRCGRLTTRCPVHPDARSVRATHLARPSPPTRYNSGRASCRSAPCESQVLAVSRPVCGCGPRHRSAPGSPLRDQGRWSR